MDVAIFVIMCSLLSKGDNCSIRSDQQFNNKTETTAHTSYR